MIVNLLQILYIKYKSINCYFFHGSFSVTFSMSSKDSGIFLPLVSGRKSVRKPEVIAMTVKMRVGMTGWISARAATVVDRVPPSFETKEEDPTPAALTVVGINSPVYM